MNENLLAQIHAAQESLIPQFKALRSATGALRNANKLAAEERHDAIAMQKVLVKLQLASELVEDDALSAAVETFATETQAALDALAFEFARDLKEVFEERGERVEGRPQPWLWVDWCYKSTSPFAKHGGSTAKKH